MNNQTEEQKAYNREQMAKVRADVKAFVEKGETKGLDHLGDYPKTMDNAVRTIIALQDLLERSMDRHRRASENLRMVLEDQELDLEGNQIVDEIYAKHLDALNIDMEVLKRQKEGFEAECNRQAEGWRNANRLLAEANHQITDLTEELNAHRIVIRSTMTRTT